MKQRVMLSEIVIPKYRPLFRHNSPYRHIILTSGRAGTKSSAMAIRADYQLVENEPGSVVILRKHHNKLRKTVYKEVLRALNRLKIPKDRFAITKSPMEVKYKKNGNTIYFAGSDSVDDTKGIIDEDRPIRLVVLDELTEFFDKGEGEDEIANIEATFVRGNRGRFQMLYLYNPPKNPNAPINQWCRKMEQRPDCLHIHTDYRDVPAEWLGPDLIASAEAMRQSDEKMYRWVWLGESVGVDELIYYMFADRHISRPAADRRYQIGIIGGDYGQQNATTFQVFGLDQRRCHMDGLLEFYHSGRETGKQKTPAEYADACIGLMDEAHETHGIVRFFVFLDPSAKGLQEEIRRKVKGLPYAVSVRDAENDVKLGISRVQKALIYELLSASPGQQNQIREYGLYEYDKKSIEKGNETPIKADDHCMDAVRYAVMGAWKWLRRWLPENEDAEETDERWDG